MQEYLSEAKEGGSFGAIAGVPYRFVFYLHQKPEKQPSRAATKLTIEGWLSTSSSAFNTPPSSSKSSQ